MFSWYFLDRVSSILIIWDHRSLKFSNCNKIKKNCHCPPWANHCQVIFHKSILLSTEIFNLKISAPHVSLPNIAADTYGGSLLTWPWHGCPLSLCASWGTCLEGGGGSQPPPWRGGTSSLRSTHPSQRRGTWTWTWAHRSVKTESRDQQQHQLG